MIQHLFFEMVWQVPQFIPHRLGHSDNHALGTKCGSEYVWSQRLSSEICDEPGLSGSILFKLRILIGQSFLQVTTKYKDLHMRTMEKAQSIPSGKPLQGSRIDAVPV